MGNKIIVVPKNSEALNAMYTDAPFGKDVIQFSLTDKQVHELWDCSFFYNLNHLAEVNIDIGEDDCIVGVDKLKIIVSSGVFDIRFKDQEVNRLLTELKDLFIAAIDHGQACFSTFKMLFARCILLWSPYKS